MTLAIIVNSRGFFTRVTKVGIIIVVEHKMLKHLRNIHKSKYYPVCTKVDKQERNVDKFCGFYFPCRRRFAIGAKYKVVVRIIEVKRNEKHIRYKLLKEKATAMLVKTGELKSCEIQYKGFSLANM
jgi:hypothetical protein